MTVTIAQMEVVAHLRPSDMLQLSAHEYCFGGLLSEGCN